MNEPAPAAWRPFLAGDLADQAVIGVRDIAVHLKKPSESNGAGLASGSAGRALFFTYLDQVFPTEGFDEVAAAHLDRAIACAEENPMAPGLFGGFTGIAWTCEHLAGRLFEPGGDDLGLEMDRALLGSLESGSRRQDYDLVAGLTGLGVYALERLPRPSATALLERVVWHLEQAAIEAPGGVSWLTPAPRVPWLQREEFPDGYYNLGVAHGVPGVIALLAASARAGVAADRARSLSAAAFSWLLRQELPPAAVSRFPCFAAPGRPGLASPLAWCYGDPGLAACLSTAAPGLGCQDWDDGVLRWAENAALRSLGHPGISDPCLCHGASGLAHLFNRLYQSSRRGLFADAARLWFQRLLELRKPGAGIAGWEVEGGFLKGAAGIALALLAAISEVAPDWDRVLLVS